MRISDWSSDVCSSDLRDRPAPARRVSGPCAGDGLRRHGRLSRSPRAGTRHSGGRADPGGRHHGARSCPPRLVRLRIVDIAAADLPPDRIYKLLVSNVMPRPIALVSTLSANGTVNAAPFSFFNVFSNAPPLLVQIGSASCRDRVCLYV